MATPVVRVGIAAVIHDPKTNKMIFGTRKGSHGSGTIQFPGGHLDVGESWFDCAERETLEETGLVVKAKKLLAATNDIFEQEKKHYITLFILCERVDEKEPVVLEPEKCVGWFWNSWSDVKGLMNGDSGASGSGSGSGQQGEQKFFLPITNLLRDHPDIESLMQRRQLMEQGGHVE
ncbi:NUDIX hydrolase domain-like protein [Apiosordaria backusii]|uniref:NUDIX hydrolase domain-like protein n=1 Tax=Apiosordaria backusii TaxID=314023 RepID=A0AA40EA80_9PEZI|nr:NUDIX hydrolase domain-like protein [Apiosordaria backusii]